MCGTAGIYAFSPSAPPADRAELRKELPARSSPRHRPDVQQMLQQDLLLSAET